MPGSEKCVSWDFDRQDWTNRGCKTSADQDGTVTCSCSHLTNFAVLMVSCYYYTMVWNPNLFASKLILVDECYVRSIPYLYKTSHSVLGPLHSHALYIVTLDLIVFAGCLPEARGL